MSEREGRPGEGYTGAAQEPVTEEHHLHNTPRGYSLPLFTELLRVDHG